MDLDTVRLMIDKGYRLGLHGHQHKSEASPYSLHTSEEHVMAVVSTGSLCAGSAALPTGAFRQYNLIQIRDDYLGARVHVREMLVPGVFSAGRLVARGGKSFADLSWTAPPQQLVNVGRSGGSLVAELDQIEHLIANGEYDHAITRLESADKLGFHGRRLMTDALFKARRWDRLVEQLSNPQNPGELATLLKALVELRKWGMADEALGRDWDPARFPSSFIRDLTQWLATQRSVHR